MTFNKSDVSANSIVPNHWKHWMTAFQQDVTCVSHWWELLLYMYSVDYIHHISATKYQDEMPDYVNNNSASSTKEYQVSRRQKDGERKKRKEKKNEKWNKNKHSLREQAESWGDKVAVCWWYGQSYDVSSWWTAEERQKGQTTTAKTRAETRPKKARADRNEVVGFRWIWIYLCLVFRGDLVCVISQGISRYIVTSCPVSCDIRKYLVRYIEISYHIYIPNFWDWYGDIVSRNFSARYRTLYLASSTGIIRQSGACVASIVPPLGTVFDPYTHDNN